MFKDKNFGLPKSLIDDVSNLLKENRTVSMKTPSAIGDRVAADVPAREEEHEKGMGGKVSRFAQPKLSSKLQGRLKKEKNSLAFPGVTEALTDEKFINYLNENYHMEKLTLEEIQYIYEKTWWDRWFGGGANTAPRTPTSPPPGANTAPPPGDIVDDFNRTITSPPSGGNPVPRPPGANTPPPSGGNTPPPSGGNPPPSSGGNPPPPSGGNPPPPSGGAQTPPTPRSVGGPTSTPTPRATTPAPVSSSPEPQDDWKSKVLAGGTGTAEGDIGSERPSPVSRRPSRPSRPSGGNGGDWKKSVFGTQDGA